MCIDLPIVRPSVHVVQKSTIFHGIMIRLAHLNHTREGNTMLAINMADVVNVLNTCKPYLIGFAVVLALAVIAIIAVRKLSLIHI